MSHLSALAARRHRSRVRAHIPAGDAPCDPARLRLDQRLRAAGLRPPPTLEEPPRFPGGSTSAVLSRPVTYGHVAEGSMMTAAVLAPRSVVQSAAVLAAGRVFTDDHTARDRAFSGITLNGMGAQSRGGVHCVFGKHGEWSPSDVVTMRALLPPRLHYAVDYGRAFKLPLLSSPFIVLECHAMASQPCCAPVASGALSVPSALQANATSATSASASLFPSHTGLHQSRRPAHTASSAAIFPERNTGKKQRQNQRKRVLGVRAAVAQQQPEAPIVKEEKDVRAVRLTDDTFTLRGRCYERFKFEVEYGLRAGTTENSYVIEGPLGAALIDVPDRAFARAFVDAFVREAKDAEHLAYLIIGHLSPKRVDSIIELAKTHPLTEPPIKVFLSNPAHQTLTSLVPADILDATFDLQIVRAGDTLDLGDGHNLQFILTPTPRWPDGLSTYDPKSQLLFTNKLFSTHVCKGEDFDVGGIEVYDMHWRYFYDCMLAPVAKQVDAALKKLPVVAQFAPPCYSGKTGLDVVKADVGFIFSRILSALNLDIGTAANLRLKVGSDKKGAVPGVGGEPLVTAAICPLHGPIIRNSVTELVREYKIWTDEKIKQAEEATVAVFYASAYGNTSALAQAISRGLLRAGVGVETINCEMASVEELKSAIQRCCGFVCGSPTLGGHMPTPMKEALGVILNESAAKGKPTGVFGSFGWSGEAVDEMEQLLKDGGFSFGFPPIRCKFKPTEGMLQICEESGRDLAREIRKGKAKQRSTSAKSAVISGSGLEQAVGRVVGSLCVVSAVSGDGDAQSAMLASWVSQASFNPPGLTVAVAKERALESLVLVGGKFALSVLGEKNVGAVSKQLLKPFQPGEPRFGDLPTKQASNGATILADAISYMECTVQTRMETGDHWVVYATVDSGDIMDEKTLTALHHRKTGSRY
ncbi:unnamed protein product [Closterium sp. NIES-64]|nr:unnamed protein product [Closterium sp. NIES-64]